MAVSDMMERAAGALSIHMFVQDENGYPSLDQVHKLDIERGARAALLAALDPEDEQMLAAVARDMWEYASDGEEYTDLVRVYWEGEARAAVLALKAIAQGEPQP